MIRKGLYPFKSFPAILGKEAAGVIVGLPTDQNTLDNEDYKQRKYEIGGKVAVVRIRSMHYLLSWSLTCIKSQDFLGTHSSYISIPWRTVYPVPASISTKTAAAAILQSVTAVSFTTEAYDVQKGDIILVHTVAGGLGQLFTQLIKARGATVIGTTSTPEKAEIAKANGADYVILYPVEDTVKRVLEITNGEGVHAVFDGVGKDTYVFLFAGLIDLLADIYS